MEGGHRKVVQDKRICCVCYPNSIEDENDFLMEYPAFKQQRQALLKSALKICNLFKNLNTDN